MARHGVALVAAGYEIIPIKPGLKHPGLPSKDKGGADWNRLGKSTKGQVRDWIAGPLDVKKFGTKSFANYGVGIKTGKTPLVDIDILDQALADSMAEWVSEHVGMAPERVGLAPKKGLLFRATDRFAKVQSQVYLDDRGDKHKVEILGEGQQFVAYAVHPDTGKPYEWLHKDGPLVTAADDLPEITREQAESIVAEFERRVADLGWKKVSTALNRPAGPSRNGGKVDLDDAFAADKARVEIKADELRARLVLVPGAEDYETWLQIGMALYHQFEGDERGLELWHEWSAEASNYDSDALDSKWPTFDVVDKGREPVTARLILKLAQAEERRLATETLGELIAELNEARTLDVLSSICEKSKSLPLDRMTRETLISIVRARYKLITGGGQLSLTIAREMVRYANPSNREIPWWLEGWVYVQLDESFASIKGKAHLSTKAFNDTMSRHLLTPQEVLEGKAVPDFSPSAVALNRYQIPTVVNRMYAPGEDEIFTWQGGQYVNTYSDKTLPEVPEKMTAADLRAIERCKAHFAHLFESARDRAVLLDWMAYIVQTQKRVSWAPIIQGTESDGKSFFFDMLGAALGTANVGTIPGAALEENFNGWAEGSLVMVIEEVRLTGQNRYAVINRLKPNITNKVVSIRRMRTDSYMVLNFTSYLMTTNFKDGMPAGMDDSRYFPLYSRFQTQDDIKAFNRRHPTYYDNLYGAVRDNPGAVRKWLLTHEIGEDFEPNKRAPVAEAKAEMNYMATSDEAEVLFDLLATSPKLDVSKRLVCTATLEDEIAGEGCAVPQTQAMKRLMSGSGFTFLGRFKVEGERKRYWSQTPDYWPKDENARGTAIREYLADPL